MKNSQYHTDFIPLSSHIKLSIIILCTGMFFSAAQFLFAQSISEIKDYFEIRDALSMLLDDLKRASGERAGRAGVTTLSTDELRASLVFFRRRMETFSGSGEPLTNYYFERLTNLHDQCSFYIRNMETDYKPDRTTVSKNVQGTRPGSKPSNCGIEGAKAQRKQYFHPIGIRTLRPASGMSAVATSGTIQSISQSALPPVISRRFRTPFPDRPPELEKQNIVAVETKKPVEIPALPSDVASRSLEIIPPPPVKNPLVASATQFVPPPIPGGKEPQVMEKPGMRPLAVMIENHSKSRPQTGLERAEIVYEIPVEGGITRFMALYYHVPEILGPIRSCREYFIDRALEVNALYVHCGGSPKGYQYIAKEKVFAIDEISNGKPFFRDNTRKPPHNLYARPADIMDLMDKKHPMQLPYQKLPLLYGKLPSAGDRIANGVTIKYHGNYSVSYVFNPANNSYDRLMNDEPHLDRESLLRISPGTVVVQEAVMKVVDDKGRQEIDFIGTGNMWVMHGGTLITGTWTKPGPREFTKYYDTSGRQVVFSSAKPVWIQVVASRNRVTFDLPQGEQPIAARQSDETAKLQ